jgi:hypothetical protein
VVVLCATTMRPRRMWYHVDCVSRCIFEECILRTQQGLPSMFILQHFYGDALALDAFLVSSWLDIHMTLATEFFGVSTLPHSVVPFETAQLRAATSRNSFCTFTVMEVPLSDRWRYG